MCDIRVVQHIEVCANLSLEFIPSGMATIPAQSLKKRRENAKAGDTQTRRTYRTKPSFIYSWSISHILKKYILLIGAFGQPGHK